MNDTDEQFQQIQKEIIEARSLIIKTNNLTNTLAADIKTIAKRQQQEQQGVKLNSWVAYVIFAGLTFLGLKLASDAKLREIEAQSLGWKTELEAARQNLSALTSAQGLEKKHEADTQKLYALMRDKQREAALVLYEELKGKAFSPTEAVMFRDQMAKLKAELSQEKYLKAMEWVDQKTKHAESIKLFEQALAFSEEGPHRVVVQLAMAQVLKDSGKVAQAKLLAKEISEQVINRELQDDGVYLLAQCAITENNWEEAKQAVQTYAHRWPRGFFSKEIRQLSGEIARRSLAARL